MDIPVRHLPDRGVARTMTKQILAAGTGALQAEGGRLARRTGASRLGPALRLPIVAAAMDDALDRTER